MNQVLGALYAGGDEKDALARSFADAAQGFGAEKALLLLVENAEPLRLQKVHVQGLSPEQVSACERGESVKGVSSSIIRAVIASREPLVLRHLDLPPGDATPALAGEPFSVLCAPVLDPVRDVVLAVMYFQTRAFDAGGGYDASDVAWVQGYTSAVGRAFALHWQEQRRQQELAELLQGADRPEDAPEIIGDSAHTRALRRVLHEAHIPALDAPDPDPLLILGEKGTGKDLIARYVHAYSARRSRPFVAVNCAEITDDLAAARFFGHKRGAFSGAVADEPGFFRAAHGGVLFLDEIAELSLRAQGTLLRVLENRTLVPVGETKEITVDVQVILATNRDPAKAVAAGVIKADLFDRFKTQAIHLEPLRERPWDVPSLAQHFLAHHERRTRKRTLGFAEDALRALTCHPWPGNVRELARVCSVLVTHARAGAPVDRALLERACPDVLTLDNNPKAAAVPSAALPLKDAVRSFERELILTRLEQHHWNVRAARQSLGLPKTTFHRYLASLGIKVPDERLVEGD
jgi:DNA-binding NtrC family response regulator